MLNKRILKIGTVIILSAFIFGISILSVISYSQGSDPIVTLSYLTEIILPQMKKDIVAEVTVMTDKNEVSPDISEETSETPNENTVSNTGTYELLELENGKCVYSNSILEFIVRPGSEVQMISPFEAQGAADITNRTEHLNEAVIPINSYCIIPRGGDGRGIKVTNEKSYILVRGEYYIV